MRLPPEIQDIIFQYSATQTLKNARLACRIFQQIASKYLFDTLYVSTDMADLHIAKMVVQRFAPFLRTLVYSSRYYRLMSEDEVASNCGAAKCPPDHVGWGFRRYKNLERKQKEVYDSKEHILLLTYVFATATGLVEVLITDTRSTRTVPNELMAGFESWGIENACPVKGCVLTDEQHCQFQVNPESGFVQDAFEVPWETVLDALLTTNAKIREITMVSLEPMMDEVGAVDISSFYIPDRRLGDARLLFENLTHLHLHLRLDEDEDEPRESRSNPIAKILAMSKGLRHLTMEIHDSPEQQPITSFNSMFGDACLPKLTNLDLVFFDSKEAELSQFLRQSKDLESLDLMGHGMTEGSWESFADQSKQFLPKLSYVSFNSVSGPLDTDHKAALDSFSPNDYALDNFYFRGGKNPFTIETVRQQGKRDWRSC